MANEQRGSVGFNATIKDPDESGYFGWRVRYKSNGEAVGTVYGSSSTKEEARRDVMRELERTIAAWREGNP